MNRLPGTNAEELSYLALRKIVGIIGCTLPFALVFGKTIFQGSGIEDSVSGYYYTDMGTWFVGSLCAIGVFLLATKGYGGWDVITGILAGVFAIGVGLLPTTLCDNPTETQQCIGHVHLTCAALLFFTLGCMSLFLFTKTNQTKENMTAQKRQRNCVYRICGVLIFVCIGVILVYKLSPVGTADSCVAGHALVFWFESIAIVAFGFAWLVKGETILKDK